MSSPERSCSLAVDAADRFSDVDLTFGIADDVRVADVLEDWTRTLIGELHAVHIADLERGPTTYRVLLLPDALQFDLSMTPAGRFRPAGPRFRLLFGETVGSEPDPTPAAGDLFIATPSVPADIFGWGVIYALHSRACIERGRAWQAEHHVGAVRDHALSLACLRQDSPRCRRAPTTTFPRRPSPGSRMPTSSRSNLPPSGRRSPPPSAR